jgi:hypothetical protein
MPRAPVALRTCCVCEERLEAAQLRPHQELHLQAGLRPTADPREMVRARCQLCRAELSLGALRTHIKKVHGVGIQEYKAQHRVEPLEMVFHQCGLCGELVLHDSDSIGHHLKGHPSHTHRQYSEQFLPRAGRPPASDLLSMAVATLGLPESPSDPFQALPGRVSSLQLNHEEQKVAGWPHTCAQFCPRLHLRVLDTTGLHIAVSTEARRPVGQ